MNEEELESYEAELRQTRPAPPPELFMARLQAVAPMAEVEKPWWRDWRWIAPAMAAAAAVAGLLVARAAIAPVNSAKDQPPRATYGFKVDDVRVDQELESSFDVVAKLPGGEPVRFRCEKWKDQWVMTDTNHGVEIVRERPRVEVVPVRIETY